MRNQSPALIILLMASVMLAGCAGQPNPATKASAHVTAAQPHLLTPETDEDLTALSDGALKQRIARKRREVGRFMNEAIGYTLETGNQDLSRDPKYQQLLRSAKQADTDLFALERERDRRASQPTN